MLTLTSVTQAIAPNLLTSFLGVGGIPPYTYSVLPGGAGGTINPGTGEYTAPDVTGIDTVQVTDSLAAVATLDISVMTAMQLFCDIIQKEMGLGNGRVYLWDQKIDRPKDAGIYIPIGVISCKPFGNTNEFNDGDSVQSANFFYTLSVDIISRGPEARDRKEEIILALDSDYAHAQQELNGFHIGRISSGFVNLSQEDGAAIPYRYNISVGMQYAVIKTKAVPYFDSFSHSEVIEP